ncbi:MAG: hypothetical protein K2X48_06545, partial [Chitinophagaceae bacterium]|nr:hypothetical protein [Chitinophagaceae bacterium]
MPTQQHVPNLKEKNDSRLTASLGTPAAGNETNYSIQAAYAITNHFALTGGINGTYNGTDNLTTTINNVTKNFEVRYKRPSFELGAGIFYPISKDKKVMFETYAGYGAGKNNITEFINNVQTNFHNSRTNRFYVQPILSFHPADFISISGSVRYNNIGYNSITTGYTNTELINYKLSDLSLKRIEFLEPSLAVTGGVNSVPWLRLQTQLTSVNLLSGVNINYRVPFLSLAVQIDP